MEVGVSFINNRQGRSF